MKIRTTLFVLLSILTLGACSNKLPDPPTTYQSSSQPKTYVPNPNALGSINRVYGNLDTSDKTQTSNNLYKDKLDNLYQVTEEGIYQVTIDLKIPFDKNSDAETLTQFAAYFMEEDSQLLQQNSPTEFIYHSNKINKNYLVNYSLDNNGKVILIYVTKDTSNTTPVKDSNQEDDLTDKVYGTIDLSDKTETSENIYKDRNENIYLLLDGKISQVTVDLPIPFDMNLDASYLTDRAKDYMESDVQFLQQNSPTEFVYYSSKIDKKYIVTYSLDNNGNVVVMYVSRDLSDVKLP